MTTNSPIRLPFTLPFADAHYKPPNIIKLAQPTKQRLLPVGEAYRLHAARALSGRSHEEYEKILEEEAEAKRKGKSEEADHDTDADIGDEPESVTLLNLDPRDWKNHDQYAVLGLSALRWKATPDQIKRAHRRKVLRHHPDKKAGKAGNTNDDSFFKCVAKAYDVLSDPVRRRQFDSIDQGVDDDDVPSAYEVEENPDPEGFCNMFRSVFEREARFSIRQPVPGIGNMESSRQEVEEFYNFWLTFDSWRSFEWKDKDVNEGSDSRQEKRHNENKNRSERERLKKVDNTRRRHVVEIALAQDPRMARFKDEDRTERERKKLERWNASPAGNVAAKTQLDQGAGEAERNDFKAEQQQAPPAPSAPQLTAEERAALKKAKEAAKKSLKREVKAVNSLIITHNYFLLDGQTAGPSTVEAQLGEVDTLAAGLQAEEFVEMRKAMEAVSEKGKGAVKQVVVGYCQKVSQNGQGSFKEFV